MSFFIFLSVFGGVGGVLPVSAHPIEMNEIQISNPPSWLKAAQVRRTLDRVMGVLEWDLRRVEAVFYQDPKAFNLAHGLGPGVLAFSFPSAKTIGFGPKVDADNFDSVFAHELTHHVLFQKFKSAIPKWIEEGAANYIGQRGKMDPRKVFAYLESYPDFRIESLQHPFRGQKVDTSTHYLLSLAAMQMISEKCPLQDLLQLSVGKKFETYLKTFCGFSDVTDALRRWSCQKSSRSCH